MGNKVMGKFRKARHQGFQEDQIDYLQYSINYYL